ncbi:MAG: DnaA/Hda family protein, partial [Hyphomicrobiales bacterium]
MGDDELNMRQGADELLGEFGFFGGVMDGTGDVEGQQIETNQRPVDDPVKRSSPDAGNMTPKNIKASSGPSDLKTLSDTTAKRTLPDMTDGDDNDEDFQEIWQGVLVRLRAELGEDVFTSWFLRVELEGISGGVVTLSAATRFLRNWIMSHFKETLIEFWADQIGTVHKLDVRVRSNLHVQSHGAGARAGDQEKTGHASAQSGQSASARRLADMRINPAHVGDQRGTRFETGARAYKSGKSSGVSSNPQMGLGGPAVTGNSLSLVHSLSSALDRRYVFDSFCAGAANKVAFEAARSVAMALPGAPVLYNPLYLHGSVGLGKTHLLQAIANQAASTGTRQVVYLTAERFMSNFVQA